MVINARLENGIQVQCNAVFPGKRVLIDMYM